MRGARLRSAGLAGILGVAALRSMVLVEPYRFFADVDPAFDRMPLLALGMTGSQVLDLALLLAAAIALVGEARSGRGVRIGLVVLALVPVPAAVLHARTGIVVENGFRSDTWIAAMLAFVALAHLVRDRACRAVALSVLLGLVALLAVRGAVQVFVEHPATVALYEETRERFLAERGWAPGSSAARTYERRLLQVEATGWFGLSNPFSTMMGVGAVGLAGLAGLRAHQRKRIDATSWALAAVGVVCALLLVVNGGKGALAATAIALGVHVICLRRTALPSPRWALVLALAALAAVGARWLVGTRIGELSLLFRGYYLEAGLRILGDPEWAFFGCGPARVQEWFNAAKPAECPEDVKSLHSVFADWLVGLGLAGCAWCAVVVAAYWSRRREADVEPLAPDGEARVRRFALSVALGAGAVGTLVALRVETPIVDGFWLAARLLGIVVLALVAVSVAGVCASIADRALRGVAFALGILVLVHAQVETVAWMPGSCVLALALVACGTDLPPSPQSGAKGGAADRATFGWLAATALALVATLSMAHGIRQAASGAARLEEVARSLAPLVDDRTQEYELRMEAARKLSARDYWWDRAALEAAVEQALAAARAAQTEAGRGAPAGERELAALELAEKIAWTRQLRGARADALRADVASRILVRASSGREQAFLETKNAFALLGAVERGAERMPRQPRRWMEVGAAREILRRVLEDAASAAEIADPVEAYRRALETSDALRLDPLAQLSEAERRRLAERMAALGSGARAP